MKCKIHNTALQDLWKNGMLLCEECFEETMLPKDKKCECCEEIADENYHDHYLCREHYEIYKHEVAV